MHPSSGGNEYEHEHSIRLVGYGYAEDDQMGRSASAMAGSGEASGGGGHGSAFDVGVNSSRRQREFYRDAVATAEEFGISYSVGVRREEERMAAAAAAGGIMSAYVGGERRHHAAEREPVDQTTNSHVWSATAAAGSGNSPVLRESTENLPTSKGKELLQLPMRGTDAMISQREIVAEGSIKERDHELQLQQQQSGMQNLFRISMQQSGSSTCKECGNQAKKDCVHQRCRACCRSQGFNCPTHVKSTWVPAARRRERQAAAPLGQSSPTSKRHRSLSLAASQAGSGSSISPTTAAASRHSSDVNIQAVPLMGAMPSVIRAQALFKCVRVTRLADGEDEYLYQATVNIGGHVFKGLLHDQGVNIATSATNLPDLQLGGRVISSSSNQIRPAGIYASSETVLGALR